MSYTPIFQKIIDECVKRDEQKKSVEATREYFREACIEVGQYERLNNLYRIRPKRSLLGERSRMQFFRMNEIQEFFWKNKTNRDLILKMRQGGVTTLSCLIALDLSIFQQGAQSVIMAHARDNVKKIFRITKSAFRAFQRDWYELCPVTEVVDNVTELEINETGSHLMVSTETKGLTLDFLHISEAAFIEDNRISESVESVPLSAWIVMETTPDVAAGLYYDLWESGEVGDKNYKLQGLYKNHFFPWWFHYPEVEDLPVLKPDKDFYLTDKEKVIERKIRDHLQLDSIAPHILWRRIKIAECGGDEGEFMRKYPEDPMTCFLSGSKSVFPASILVNLFRQETNPRYLGDLNIEAAV